MSSMKYAVIIRFAALFNSWIKRVMFLIMLSSLMSCNFLSLSQGESYNRAEKGFLDLSDVTAWEEKVFRLAGHWEFIYGRHIDPGDFPENKMHDDAELIKVPSTWEGYNYKGEKLPGIGIATYRLKIFTGGSSPERLTLLIPGWETAYRLYVNGIEVASAGKPGIDKAGTFSAWHPRAAHFTPAGDTQDLVVHISNFSHARGGPGMMPYIGTVDAVREIREKGVGIKLFSFGSLFMISFYHLVIFFIRRKEKSALYFSLFCMAMAIRSLVVDEQCLIIFASSIPWDIHVRITYLTLAFTVPFFTLFLRSLYEADMHSMLSKLFIASGFLYAAIIMMTPPVFFTSLIIPFQIVILAASLYCTVILILAFSRKREGAGLFLGAFIFFFLCVLNDILYHNRIITTGYIVPTGFLVFIFLQAVILAKRYSASFVKIEELFNEKTKLEGTALTLQSLSYLDFLTGVANRRRLDEYLEQEWRRAIRDRGEISFIMMDIDYFKKYNDYYGHPAGDEALKMVAAALEASIRRPADLIARYGGEEFAVLLPGTGIEGAQALAEIIRLRISDLGIQGADERRGNLSISLGCASMRPSPGDDPDDLIKRADQALYAAKSKGRNRSEIYRGQDPT